MQYIITGKDIVVLLNGKLHTVNREDKVGQSVELAIKEDRLDDIASLLDVVSQYSKLGIDVIDGVMSIKGTRVSQELSERIKDYAEKGLPLASLAKFAHKVSLNPSFNSRMMLYKFLEHNGHPLTKDGNFIAYRGVRSDNRDMHTGKYDNSVGQVLSMDRNEVDDNPNNTCSYGFHVATYSYASGFGNKTVAVEVDPTDVVCVPTDYDGTKMRVCKFKVVEEIARVLPDGYYNDDTEVSDNELDDYDACGCSECNPV